MKLLYILLILIILVISISFLLMMEYNKISLINTKINNANDKLNSNLKKRYNLIKDLITLIKKITKKNYLKEFDNINIDTINNYELDRISEETLDYLIKLIEDNKSSNTKDTKNILVNIKEINQKINASKKYFNKNNHELLKYSKGKGKLFLKLFKITIRISYEIKEPTN